MILQKGNSVLKVCKWVVGTTLLFSSWAQAAGAPKEAPSAPLEPSTRYSGSAPIDLSHGAPFNNGTFGLPNAEYREWAAAPLVAPFVSSKTYPYVEKRAFIRGLRQNIDFIEAAMHGWSTTTGATSGEATEELLKERRTHSNQAIETMRPYVDNLKVAMDEAKGARSGEWDQAQSNARKALADMRAAYMSLHVRQPQ